MSSRHKRGQSLVEAALAMPFLVLLILGVADIARAFYYREAVYNAARQALRYSVSSQASGNTACATGSPAGTLSTPLPPSSGSGLYAIGNAAAYESTSTGVVSGTAISGATLTVTWHCTGTSAYTNATASSTDPLNAGSDAVRVQLSYTMPLVTPFVANFLGTSGVAIAADLRGRAEY